MHRLLEEQPWADTGLGRTERQLLQALADAARSWEGTFVRTIDMEERPFPRDLTAFAALDRLAPLHDEAGLTGRAGPCSQGTSAGRRPRSAGSEGPAFRRVRRRGCGTRGRCARRGNVGCVTTFVPPARHLLKARDLADARYFEPLGVDDLANAAGLSRAHFSREFRAAFGESPHSYLLTRRMERAAALLRTTDRPVTDICFSVGLQSVGSFTSSFKRTFGKTPLAYRASYPPAAASALVPACVVRFFGRPQHRTFEEDSGAGEA